MTAYLPQQPVNGLCQLLGGGIQNLQRTRLILKVLLPNSQQDTARYVMQWRRTVKTSRTLVGRRGYAFDDYDPTYIGYDDFKSGRITNRLATLPSQQTSVYLDHGDFDSSIKCVGVEFVCEYICVSNIHTMHQYSRSIMISSQSIFQYALSLPQAYNNSRLETVC